MELGIVIGVVWATRKVNELKGCKLFVIQPILSNGKPVGNSLVAADPKNIAASGDKVVFVTSTDASQAFDNGFAPVNASIVELVDEII
jgi:ethanolamine utilization protein EutN